MFCTHSFFFFPIKRKKNKYPKKKEKYGSCGELNLIILFYLKIVILKWIFFFVIDLKRKIYTTNQAVTKNKAGACSQEKTKNLNQKTGCCKEEKGSLLPSWIIDSSKPLNFTIGLRPVVPSGFSRGQRSLSSLGQPCQNPQKKPLVRGEKFNRERDREKNNFFSVCESLRILRDLRE